MNAPTRAVLSWCRRGPDRVAAIVLLLASYVPILLTDPGRVSADTKTYLTLDPGEVLAQTTSMWDPSVGAGNVPHQYISYLFPIGPYYWVMEQLGVPDWLTQRILWGTIVFAAAFGAYRLARWLGWRPSSAFVVGFAYGFSPYLLSYLARLSILLLPWAAVPWMILLAAKAARTRSWRPPAQFALVVALVGSGNATALVFAGLAPVVWLISDALSGRVRLGAVVRAAAKIGVLSAAVSVWWIAALRVQGAYGIPILRYTETYEAVGSASTPAEVLRGLGYWFFYGGDRLDTWIGPSAPYVDNPLVLGLGFALAGVALLGLLAPFAGRAFCALLLFVGVVVSVGAAPLDDPSPYGRLFAWFVSDTTAGLALRSTPRAVPLVTLALAFGLASSAEWLRSRAARRAPADRATDRRPVWPQRAIPAGFVVLIALQLFPWFTGTSLTPSIQRDEELPAYETELAAWLDEHRDPNGGGRVYEIPGAEFGNYRWGGTVDPVLPGILDRPYLAREQVPQGAMGTADLLNAFERRIAEGWFEPETLRTIGRLFAADTIVTRNDLEHERYRLVSPGHLWTDVTAALGDPDHAGPTVTDEPVIPVLDATTLAHPDAADEFPVVAAFDLQPTAEVTAVSADDPVIVAGDGDALVDLAGAGLLDPERPILYAATLADLAAEDRFDPAIVGEHPWWVVTDRNRKQGRHWSSVGSVLGPLETTGPVRLDPDEGDNRLDVFVDDVEHQTIAVHEADVADVRASYAGNLITYTPEDAPWFAIDGDPTTAWRAGVFDATRGLGWEVDLREPADAGEFTLLQPIEGAVSRYITKARVTLDDDVVFDVDLDESSRALPGQTIAIPVDSFQTLRIEVLADNVGKLSDYGAQPGVGLAEVTIPGVRDDRVVALPDLADFGIVAPGATAEQRLTYVLTRERIDPATPNRFAPEPAMARTFRVPSERGFVMSGEARLSAEASDAVLLDVLDDRSGAVADRRLAGTPDARGASAFDGHLDTAWQTPFDRSLDATLTVEHPAPVATRSLTVAWWDDGRHSLPRELVLTGDDGVERRVAVPPTDPVDGVATATIPIDDYRSAVSSIRLTALDALTTPEYFSGRPDVLPVAISEIQFGDDPNVPSDRTRPVDSSCRDDLVTIDGVPTPVRLIGTVDDALSRAELAVEACDGPIPLGAGPHRLDTTDGSTSGFDVDRVVLDAAPAASAASGSAVDSPDVDVRNVERTEVDATVGPASTASWLILQQSLNAGWSARVDGVDLGPPTLINGYANGWLLPASDSARTVSFEWTPQRSMTLALWFSLGAGLIVLALALFAPRGRTTAAEPGALAPGRRRDLRHGPVLAVLLAAAMLIAAGPFVAAWSIVVMVVGSRQRRLAPAAVVVAGAIVAGVIIAAQWRYGFPAGPGWPDRFGWLSPLVWAAVATVVVTALLPDGIRRRADARQ